MHTWTLQTYTHDGQTFGVQGETAETGGEENLPRVTFHCPTAGASAEEAHRFGMAWIARWEASARIGTTEPTVHAPRTITAAEIEDAIAALPDTTNDIQMGG
jgi:hypothetical protein